MANTFDVKTYSPKDVVLIIGGYQVTGWQTISITRSVKGFTPIRGIRGKNTRVPNRDTSATLTFPILQSSQSNDVLSYIHELDLEEGTARIALTLKDNSGRSVFNSNEAFITGYPSATFSGQFEYRNWEIFCQTTDTFKVYGNSRPSTSLFDGALNEATSFVEGLF
jgi:hypothetical protein